MDIITILFFIVEILSKTFLEFIAVVFIGSGRASGKALPSAFAKFHLEERKICISECSWSETNGRIKYNTTYFHACVPPALSIHA